MLNLIITDAGKQALVNAQQTGTRQLTLATIAVGSGQYTPDASQTALDSEIKRLPIIQASAIDDHVIHVAYQDDSTDSYNVYELGVFTDTGVLFAVYSSSALIIAKAVNNSCLIAVDMIIDDLDVSSISFGDVTYGTGAATTENAGVVELATEEEAEAGIDAFKAITPATMAGAFDTKFSAAFASNFVTAFADAFSSQFPGAFDSQFNDSFNNAFQAAFPSAYDSAFDDSFSPAFQSAFQTAFQSAFQSAFPSSFNSSFNSSFPSQFNSSFSSKLATNAETLTGSLTNKATTPAGVKYATTNFTGTLNKANVLATGSTATRTLADRFADSLNPMDFGAKGDGTTNDTAAFTALENANSGKMIDLEGKTYLVNARPTRNDYYNGYFKVSGKVIDPASVNISGGEIVNAKGASNPSFYPSGVSKIYQANTGTNQLTMARFSNDDAGNSLVFLKSRGSSVNQSRTALPGDNIGWLSFMIDGGKYGDYTGSLQGVRAGSISCTVSENSSLTSAGTTATGVRGAIRIVCNNDNGDYAGTGLEIMSNTCRPTDDNLVNLGTGARRWKAIYAMTDVISTSDEREKHNIKEIPKAVLDAWERVNFKQFEFNAVEGETFFGVIAQDIIKAFKLEGLDALEYGIVKEEEGKFAVRYRDCLVLEAAVQRRKIEHLEELIRGL